MQIKKTSLDNINRRCPNMGRGLEVLIDLGECGEEDH